LAWRAKILLFENIGLKPNCLSFFLEEFVIKPNNSKNRVFVVGSKRRTTSHVQQQGSMIVACVVLLTITSRPANGQLWAWVGGASTLSIDAPTVPAKGVPSNATWPDYRYHHVGWKPDNGLANFYIFGGFRVEGSSKVVFGDMWRFNYSSQGKLFSVSPRF
jgi:hypothetical protein